MMVSHSCPPNGSYVLIFCVAYCNLQQHTKTTLEVNRMFGKTSNTTYHAMPIWKKLNNVFLVKQTYLSLHSPPNQSAIWGPAVFADHRELLQRPPLQHAKVRDDMGVFQLVMGVPPARWMVYTGKSETKMDDSHGGIPSSGNPHIHTSHLLDCPGRQEKLALLPVRCTRDLPDTSETGDLIRHTSG